MKQAPLARQASLVVKELPEETLVYDVETDKAHCLNDTAARVWKSCDGQTSVNEIAQNLSANLDTPVDENVVWLALDQLEKFKLLEHPVEKPAWLNGVSRRQVVRALGVAVIVAPIISSIVVPTAAQSLPVASCGCLNPNDCTTLHGPGFCCTPHNACTNFPSTKGCIMSPPPCK